jgi:hypothetical protein
MLFLDLGSLLIKVLLCFVGEYLELIFKTCNNSLKCSNLTLAAVKKLSMLLFVLLESLLEVFGGGLLGGKGVIDSFEGVFVVGTFGGELGLGLLGLYPC